MKKKKNVLDSNIILRSLVKDHPEHYSQVKTFFENAEMGSLEIPDTVVCEVVFTLETFYELSKDQIIEYVESFILFQKFNVNQMLLINTLKFFKNNNVSFLDAYLCAKSKLEEKELVTFDKGILRIKEVKTIKP